MKKEFSIVNHAGKTLTINGVKLLRLLHDAVDETLRNHRNHKADKKDFSKVESGKYWLDSTGHFVLHSTKQDVSGDPWFPMDIKLQDSTVRINQSTMVVFPRDKHSYEDITAEIFEILKRSKLSHSELAQAILVRLSGKAYPETITDQADKEFLDCLIVLMFGVEVSRNNDTLLTTLLLLDLIKAKQVYGRRNTPFDWKCAFISRNGYCWDDFEHNNYGGKYPMSQKSTGPGNLGKGLEQGPGVLEHGRGQVFSTTQRLIGGIRRVHDYQEDSILNMFNEYPQRHAVPRREISLMVHWLESLPDALKATLFASNTEEELLGKIKELFKQRLTGAYLGGEEKEYLQTPLGKDFVPLQFNHSSSFSVTRILLSHTKDTNPKGVQEKAEWTFHRLDVVCKLIPGWIGNQETKKLSKDADADTIQGNISGFIKKDDYTQDDCKCLYCYSRPFPQEKLDYSPKNTRMGIAKDEKHLHMVDNAACKVSDQLKNKTTQIEGITQNRGAIMFFGHAKKKGMDACPTCFPVVPVEQMAKANISSSSGLSKSGK